MGNKLLIAVIFFLFSYASAFGATYYIDYDAGDDTRTGTQAQSSSTPWATAPGMVTKGGVSRGSYTHSAGDKFVFKGGVTWPSTVFEFVIQNSGGSGNPDIYTGGQLEGTPWGTGYPVFDGEESLTIGKHMIYASGKTNITINGIKFYRMGSIATPSTDKAINILSNPSGWVISNCNFDIYGKDAVVVGAGTGAYSGITIHNNSFVNCTNDIQISNDDGSTLDDVVISNNLLGDNYGIVIAGDHPDGIHLFLMGSMDNLVIKNNRFYGDWGAGTAQIYLSARDIYTNVEIYNNVLGFDNTEQHGTGYQFSPGQMYINRVDGLKLYNNTISSDGYYEANAGGKTGIYLSGVSGADVKNNIVSKMEWGIILANDFFTADKTYQAKAPWGEYGALIYPSSGNWNNKLYRQSGWATPRKSDATTEPTWCTTLNCTVNDNGILWLRLDTYNASYSAWQANTAYTIGSVTTGDKINPSTSNGYSYVAYLGRGAVGSSEPDWSLCPNKGDTCTSGDIVLTNMGTMLTSDYNYIYPRAGEHWAAIQAGGLSKAQWNAYGYDLNSLGDESTPPGFTAVPPGLPGLANLSLAEGSPCISAGSDLSASFTTDITGATRSTWDIGAYAYGAGTTQYTLTITATNATVTSSPAGINCGATCTYDFGDGTEVTLSATCSTGYQTPVYSTNPITMNGPQDETVSCSAIPVSNSGGMISGGGTVQ